MTVIHLIAIEQFPPQTKCPPQGMGSRIAQGFILLICCPLALSRKSPTGASGFVGEVDSHRDQTDTAANEFTHDSELRRSKWFSC
ncbi:MAG TPA: hypothetical protein V6C65_02490 [Allocoleopsis sp.]